MTGALIITTGRTDHKSSFMPERQIGKISALERMVLLFQMAGIQCITVVGDEKEQPQKLVPSMNLVFLTVSSEGEMLDSIRQGLMYLQNKCTEVLVSHVNIPMFSQETVQMLLDKEGDVCIPRCHGRCGHPILLRKNCFLDIIRYNGQKGLRGAIESAGFQPQIVETEDVGILSDRDSQTSYEDLSERHDIRKLTVSTQVRIRRERIFYGPGIHQLLTLTEESGSLSNACQRMGISYTKGRKIVATMEEQTGKLVLKTGQGGKHGGYSHLTESAKEFMDCYKNFQKEADQVVQELFQKHFQKLDRVFLEELESRGQWNEKNSCDYQKRSDDET